MNNSSTPVDFHFHLTKTSEKSYFLSQLDQSIHYSPDHSNLKAYPFQSHRRRKTVFTSMHDHRWVQMPAINQWRLVFQPEFRTLIFTPGSQSMIAIERCVNKHVLFDYNQQLIRRFKFALLVVAERAAQREVYKDHNKNAVSTHFRSRFCAFFDGIVIGHRHCAQSMRSTIDIAAACEMKFIWKREKCAYRGENVCLCHTK